MWVYLYGFNFNLGLMRKWLVGSFGRTQVGKWARCCAAGGSGFVSLGGLHCVHAPSCSGGPARGLADDLSLACFN